MRVDHEKKRVGVKVDYERKSDGVRVDHEKKSDGVRTDHKKKSDGVRLHHQKERWGKSSRKRKSDGVRVHYEKRSGCDTVSYFVGKGKRTAFQGWKSNPEVTEIFRVLSSPQDMVYEEECHALERFVVVMYSRTCPHHTVNKARQVLLAQGNKSIENIPPTQAALA